MNNVEDGPFTFNPFNPRAALGTEGKNNKQITRLNFHPRSEVNQLCVKNNPGTSIAQCNKATVVHEFGHILGMAHEQNRPEDVSNSGCHENNENPTTIDRVDYTTYGNTFFTGYDRDSIMNYCRRGYGARSDLSPTDKLAVKVYYGRIPIYADSTGVLEIPVIKVNGVPHKASLQYNAVSNTFLLTAISPTSLKSSANATFVGSTMDLPMVSFFERGHVTQVYHAVFKRISGNKFILTHIDVRSDTLR